MRIRKKRRPYDLSSLFANPIEGGSMGVIPTSTSNKGTGVPGEEYTQLSGNATDRQYQNAARNYQNDIWRKQLRGKPTWANAGHMYGSVGDTAQYMKLFNYILSRPRLESGVIGAYNKLNKAKSLADRLKHEGEVARSVFGNLPIQSVSQNELSPEDLALIEYYGGGG